MERKGFEEAAYKRPVLTRSDLWPRPGLIK